LDEGRERGSVVCHVGHSGAVLESVNEVRNSGSGDNAHYGIDSGLQVFYLFGYCLVPV
jgi:hypothetical protein